MQPCRDECLAGLNVASDSLAQTPVCFERDQCGIGVLFVALLYRRLDGSKVFHFIEFFLSHGTSSVVVEWATLGLSLSWNSEHQPRIDQVRGFQHWFVRLEDRVVLVRIPVVLLGDLR